jgi:nucleoside-diphosphate-sugar epimerase
MKPTIAIAGASGFIGRWFIEKYHQHYNIIAFTRKDLEEEGRPNVEWRKVDMYSLSSTKMALEGADFALYLVHSMNASTRLNQGSFEDTDLLLADNFARSAEECGLKQIIFMGGILPKDRSKFSRHLRSRYETELTLGSRKTPLTALRAGVIIGPGGSSFRIVEKLIKKLPIMACPKWTKSESQPIDVMDTLQIIHQCINNEAVYDKAIEIGGKEVISYIDLLRKTAKIMGKKRLIFSIPFFTLGFSKLWVGLFSNSNRTLVSPLIESLRHDMKIDNNYQFDIDYTSLTSSLKNGLKEDIAKIPKRFEVEEEKNTVRSYQRLNNPGDKSTAWVAEAYPLWLSKTFKLILTAKKEDELVVFRLLGIKLLALEYIPERSDDKRYLFYIVGGSLAKRLDYGWLEFRSVLNNKHIIAAIHEFVPSLPWFLYKNTQAVVHLWIMNSFGRYISSRK